VLTVEISSAKLLCDARSYTDINDCLARDFGQAMSLTVPAMCSQSLSIRVTIVPPFTPISCVPQFNRLAT